VSPAQLKEVHIDLNAEAREALAALQAGAPADGA
jgi:hypothetical protein